MFNGVSSKESIRLNPNMFRPLLINSKPEELMLKNKKETTESFKKVSMLTFSSFPVTLSD